MNREIIIDATDGILGRVAAYAAKQSLLGKKVFIVNCNNVLLTGRRVMILDEYKTSISRGGAIRKGPHFPRSPERIMKRTVRGMVYYKEGRGREAFKRIICYNDVPPQFEKVQKISLKREPKTRTTKLSEISKDIWR